MNTITLTTIADIVSVFANAKNGGQFATIEGASEIKLNKFPTDNSERIRIKDGFQPMAEFTIQFHFGADYERAMAKAMGVADYTASDSNRKHLVPNLVMQYLSTGNVCVIYMPTNKVSKGITLNGKPISEEDKAYMEHYKAPKRGSAMVEYRTISVKNIKRITFGGITYLVDLNGSTELRQAE
ncbi:MAG: hypothetical protein MJ066_06230 [Clostridia bacterium]|nr:hypothetical protein [Clostridia bacterium]